MPTICKISDDGLYINPFSIGIWAIMVSDNVQVYRLNINSDS